MEKKYCKHCKRITDEVICEACGNNEFQAIVISVQASSQYKKD